MKIENFGNFLTPWGTALEIKAVLVGRVYKIKATAGGGFYIEPDSNEFIRIHEAFPLIPEDKRWFEDELSWIYVVMALPELFDPEEIEEAEKLADLYYKGIRPAK